MPKTAAIQKDVTVKEEVKVEDPLEVEEEVKVEVKEEEDTVPELTNFRDEIVKNHRHVRTEDIKQGKLEHPELFAMHSVPVEIEEAEELELELEPEPVVIEEAEELELEPEPVDEMVTINVSGVSKQVRMSKIVDAGTRSLQKDGTADQRLAEATRLLQEAKATKLLSPPSDSLDVEELASLTEKVTGALFLGKEDETTEALTDLVTALQKKPTSTENITTQDVSSLVAVEVAQAERVREVNLAKVVFAKDFPKINSDPELYTLAGMKTVTIQKDHPDWTPQQVLTKAGEDVNKLINQSGSKTETVDNLEVDLEVEKSAVTNAGALDAKHKAKRVTKPAKGADVRVQAKPVKKPLTPAEIVANIRHSRLAT